MINVLIGYPPPDTALRDWLLLLKKKEQKDVTKLLHGFLTSLLDVTLERLTTLQNGDTFLHNHF
jgi:hypothetical protein